MKYYPEMNRGYYPLNTLTVNYPLVDNPKEAFEKGLELCYLATDVSSKGGCQLKRISIKNGSSTIRHDPCRLPKDVMKNESINIPESLLVYRDPDFDKYEGLSRYNIDLFSKRGCGHYTIADKGVCTHCIYLKFMEKSANDHVREGVSHFISRIRKGDGTKTYLTYLYEELFGYTVEEFKGYIESKFEPWMSWDNYGRFKKDEFEENLWWQIGHHCSVKSLLIHGFYRCSDINRLANLAPQCAKDNLIQKQEDNPKSEIEKIVKNYYH